MAKFRVTVDGEYDDEKVIEVEADEFVIDSKCLVFQERVEHQEINSFGNTITYTDMNNIRAFYYWLLVERV